MNENGQNILLVDDEMVIRRLLRERLSGEGYSCDEAGDARQAMEKLSEKEADLVILDIKMPGKSGAELLPELKAEHPDTMVIMASAVFDTQTAIQCMKQGAYDYFTKPFSLEEVSISVSRALDKRRLELELRAYRQDLEAKVAEQAAKIREGFLNAIMALALALEAKDEYTRGHSERVAEISVDIARELGVPDMTIEKIRLAGLLHDIGKIGVREVVLNKPGKLTSEEYEHVMSHSEIGERILGPVVEDSEILEMVRHHHERYDGTGYPDGLSGKQLSRGARILAVADAYTSMAGDSDEDTELSQNARILAVADTFDAMTSDRSYREALTAQEAMTEIKHGTGTQFDPEIVGAFLKTRGYKE